MGQAIRKFEVIEGGSFGGEIFAPKEPTKEPLRNLGKWVLVDEVAALADVSPRMVRKAVDAGRWRGADLMTREEASNVGRGGKVLRVHVDSLPADLRAAWYAQHGIALHEAVDAATGETRLIPEDAGRNDPKWDERSAVAQWRLNIIREASRLKKGTPERKAALDALAAREHAQPNGKMKRISRATLYSWLGDYDAGGFLGLMPDARKDKGVAKTIVSTAWDGFFAGRVTPADHQRIGDELTHYIRSAWASGAAGWRVICELSTTRLIEISRDLRDLRFDQLPLGDLSDAAGAPTQFGTCSVSAYAVRAQQQYKVVSIRNKDNARYQDTIAPTIRRDYSQLKPREIVVGDVHPMDIMVRRPNGRPAYPKAISWFDPATGEVHMTIVLLEENEGVRREHVAMSFDAMVAKWGLPKLLYLDNGSEYNDTNMLGGFTMLSKLAGMTVKENSRADERVLASEEAVIRSLPYNAKGKPGIEGLFGNLEQVFFSGVKGWTAGDRMKKKTHAKGKDPIPFPGDMTEFMHTINVHLDHYHKRPFRDGRSPNERLRAHIEAGWGKTVLGNPEDLALAFSSEITRVPERGCISYAPRDGGSQRYYLDDLLGLLPGTPVTVRVPAYDPQFLFVFDEAGQPLGVARPEQTFNPLDKAGAAEGGRRSKFLRRKVTEQSRHCALLDLTEEVKRHLGHLPEAPEAPVAAVVSSEMLSRMREVEAEDRARLAAPDTTPKRAPSQWGNGTNAALSNVKFEGEGGE